MKCQYLPVLSLSLTLCVLSAAQAVSLAQNKQLAAIQNNSSPTNPQLNALAEDYGKLPLGFEANTGQTDVRVKFLSRGRGYTLFLTGNEAVLALPKIGVTPSDGSATSRVLRMKLVGANLSAAVTGAQELPGKSNYFIGKDPSKWRTNVPNYAQVKYPAVYPGVDLLYYGNQGGQLEYDFVVAPGAEPSAIKLNIATDSVSTAKAKQHLRLRISANGDLVARMSGGEIRLHKPIIYQNDENGRAVREGRFILAANQVRFALGPYDHAKPLIIDPVLSYSTYLGGSSVGFSTSSAIAVDSSGNAYIVGSTTQIDFPTQNAFQTYASGGDAFVTKLAPSGSTLVYSTFLSGSNGATEGYGIAVDASGAAYVTGLTESNDFPTVKPIQATLGAPGSENAFITKLDPTGAALVYSTYYGGSAGTRGIAIAVDTGGDAYVTGATLGTLTTVNALQPVYGGNGDAFVAKLNPAGSAFIYATYLGGTEDDEVTSIAVDSSGNAYVAGSTTSYDFPTQAPFQAANNTLENQGTCFVAKLNATGSALVYSTYLGGSKYEQVNAIAVDVGGDAYVAGETASADFPTQNPLQATNLAASGGGRNGFVTEFNPAGSALVYSTYLGGGTTDTLNGIAVDSVGNTYVGGTTSSVNFPTVNPLPVSDGGLAANSTIAELNAGGSVLVFSTHFGANSIGQTSTTGSNSIEAIAIDSAGNLYVTGDVDSTIYPTLNAFQATYTAIENIAFIAKFAPSAATTPTVTISVAPTTISAGQSANLTWSSTNATSCSASGGWTGTQSTSGTASESPTVSGSTTYTLTCTGTGGSAQGSATLTVTAAAPTVTISVNPTSVTVGQSASLTWSTTNATACTASGAWTGTQATSGTQSETPAASGNSTYTLACTGAGGSANASAALTVNAATPALTVTLTISPTSITVGQSATLTWSSTNATSCTASGAWTGTQATSGTMVVTPTAAGAATYMLTCSGTASATATRVVNLTVTAQLASVTVLSGKAGGGGLGLWSLLGLGLMVASRMRRMWRPALATIALCAALAMLAGPAPVSAQEASSSLQFNWDQTYVGIRAGRGSYWESSGQLDSDLAANGESGTTTLINQHRIGGVLYAGVPFYRALSLELGLVDLGEYPVRISTMSTNIPQLAQTIIRNLSSAGRGLTLNLSAPLDITRWFAFEPRFGILAYQSKQEVYTPLGTFSHDREGGGIDAGLALLFRPTSSVYFGAGVDCFDTGGNRCDVLLYSAELEYHFGR